MIGVLALQGDFIEHEYVLRSLGEETRQVRRISDLDGLAGLIMPGGESTTFSHLMLEFNLQESLKRLIASRFPVWGTCAGMIVMAKRVSDLEHPTLDALDLSVRRNAYGRQAESFETKVDVPVLGAKPFHAVFIRAPVVEEVGQNVEILARLKPEGDGTAQGSTVAVRQDNLLATTFHPELSGDFRFHRYFLEVVKAHKSSQSSFK